MDTLRKIILLSSTIAFRFALFGAISVYAAISLYGSASYIKSLLQENQVYEQFVDAVIDSNKDATLSGGDSVTISDPDIRAIANSAFPAGTLQQAAETAIDQTFAWLDGTNATVSFEIDFRPNKQSAIEQISRYGVDRVANLPQCIITPEQIDPFSATCRPIVFDREKSYTELLQQVQQQLVLLEDPVITAEDVLGSGEDDSGVRTIDQSLPAYYSALQRMPAWLFAAVFGCAIIIILTSRTRRAGVHRIGYGLTSTSISLVVFSVLFTFIAPLVSKDLPIIGSNGVGIEAVFNQVASQASRDYTIMVIKIAVPLALFGLGMLLLVRHAPRQGYRGLARKTGIANSIEPLSRSSKPKSRSERAPVQSSESSETKPQRSTKSRKYRTIPKKEFK